MRDERDINSQHRVRLPGAGDGEPGLGSQPDPDGQPGRERGDSLRRVRRISNWTAAALIAGTGATTVALASHALAPSASSTSYGTSGSNSAATGAQGQNAPSVNGSVATSGGSGVTVTTTKKVVNGHTVITQVRHVNHNTDN